MIATDDVEMRMKLLFEARQDLLKRNLSNAENYDKAILTFSTATLGFSVAFLKDFVPMAIAKWPVALYASWILLIGALIATLVSYWTSQYAISRLLVYAEQYYLQQSGEQNPRAWSDKLTNWLSYAAGAMYILGIILTTIFVSLNITGVSQMSNDDTSQRVNVQKGAPVPDLLKIPQQQPPQTPSTPGQATVPPKPDGTQTGKN